MPLPPGPFWPPGGPLKPPGMGGRTFGTTRLRGPANDGGIGGNGIAPGSIRGRFEVDGARSSGTGHAIMVSFSERD